jgi:hypothetical protein
MRICGKHIVLLAIATLSLAACGGGGDAGAGGGNLPPVIQGTPATTLKAGTPYSFTPQAADPNGDPLTFTATNVPAWATFNTTTGALTGTPTEANVGKSSMISIEVSDSKAVAELPAFQIEVVSAATVTPPPFSNTPPTIQGTPATTATVGQLYTFMPVGDDVDGDSLTYSVQNKPAWATFTAATGELRGTPASTDVGTTSGVVITVTDGLNSTSLAAFNVAVSAAAPPANRPPTISGTPATTAKVGTAYSFRPVGSDPDGNSLVYSIQNKPSWATFSASTGQLAGTPTSADVGTSARITITVSDSVASVSLPSFTIQVSAAANRATSVAVGAPYSFKPTASDADGNSLTFTITNKPTWATFSTSTGLLSGTPSTGDVGSTTGIVISVSDGTAIASLASFGIAVVGTTTGTATVSWTAPTTNDDGSTLTDLAGFRVAYGQNSASLDQSAAISNASISTYTVNNLTSGQWFFAVYAVNSSGLESGISNVASKTIP